MKPLFFLCTLSLLLSSASTIDARKDLKEYTRIVIKGQSMPESIQHLLPVDPATSNTNDIADQKPNPSTLSSNVQLSKMKSFSKNFTPRPNVFTYPSYQRQIFLHHTSYNSHNNNPSVVKSFSKNLNPRKIIFFLRC
ncbi:hypothetical protein CUMW_239680 [Citrus unshiu]|uniref:Uncharacterized protein n=1 Tax=Citrus unshiu TaxID=55188 RepID=A0A2H5QKT1_CITUN|nr:hypothetical protein CUMW_239680 [Citrus unshiu]